MPPLSNAEIAQLEAKNALRQYDRLVEMIDEAVRSQFVLTPVILSELNALAVDGLQKTAGQIRDIAIRIRGTNHVPPDADLCEALLDEMCAFVNTNWESKEALHLSAYVMWRLNWIHPYCDGNGRTSRAVSYLVLCARSGALLPGIKTIPDRIAENRQPYYEALDAADAAWADGRLDLSEMEKLLEGYLAQQLTEIYLAAGGSDPGPTQ